MYQRVENYLHMSRDEASRRYPDSYLLMQRDNRDIFEPAGVILFIGDDYDELFSIMIESDIPLGVVVEGANHRRSLGGVVVGG